MNCDDEKSLAMRFDVKGFPTIKIFGADKRKPISFNGARTAQVSCWLISRHVYINIL